MLSYFLKHFTSVHSIVCINQVNLQHPTAWIHFHRLAHSVSYSFSSTMNAHAKLVGRQKRGSFLRQSSAEALGNHATKKISIAVGRKLLSFFLPATSLAPERKGLTLAGTFPAAMTLITFVKAPRALLASAEDVFFKTDFRCSGRRPEGEHLIPWGKREQLLQPRRC